VAGVIAAMLLASVACENERNVQAEVPMTGRVPQPVMNVSTGGVVPGIHPAVIYGNLKNPYAGDEAAAMDGRQLFVWYNCAGCHGGHAGGGMGPSLRDSLWRYGNSDAQLFATITEGRPQGMPTWGGKIPEEQIWKIITYIRTLNTPREPDRVLPANPNP
jgi:cytochrome c oxidase cbb3-type subunit 3